MPRTYDNRIQNILRLQGVQDKTCLRMLGQQPLMLHRLRRRLLVI